MLPYMTHLGGVFFAVEHCNLLLTCSIMQQNCNLLGCLAAHVQGFGGRGRGDPLQWGAANFGSSTPPSPTGTTSSEVGSPAGILLRSNMSGEGGGGDLLLVVISSVTELAACRQYDVM